VSIRFAWLCILAACGPSSPTLYVDVRSDLAAGEEVDAARVVLLRGADPEPIRTATYAIDAMDDLFTGARVAELGDLVDGPHIVRAELLRMGAVVARTTAAVTIAGDTGITVVITRSCGAVSCPGLGDDAGDLACLAGRCVPPDCVLGGAAACGVTECSADAECAASPGCAPSRCFEGVCFVPTAASACIDGGPRRDGGPSPRDGGPPPITDSGMRIDAGPDVDAALPSDGGAPPSGVVLFYPFDAMDTMGSIRDHAGGGYDATCEVSSCPAIVEAAGRTFRRFDGSDSIVRLASGVPTPTVAITVSAWVYIPDVLGSGSYVIVEKSRAGGATWVLEAIGGGRLGFSVTTGGTLSQAIAGTAAPRDVWIHVAGRLEEERLAVFVDGASVASTYAYGPFDLDSRPFMIGGSRSEGPLPTSHFEGDIDDVRVYDVALSNAEIAALHMAGPR
jgi:hypothetical protein